MRWYLFISETALWSETVSHKMQANPPPEHSFALFYLSLILPWGYMFYGPPLHHNKELLECLLPRYASNAVSHLYLSRSTSNAPPGQPIPNKNNGSPRSNGNNNLYHEPILDPQLQLPNLSTIRFNYWLHSTRFQVPNLLHIFCEYSVN